jgi:DMSO/TMAO reductase YedYZ heme-binding membrane subunit
MNSQLLWYTARAGGLVAWGLLVASMVWGLLMTTKLARKIARPNWMLDLHRFLGGAAVVFTGIHVASIMLDSYVHFGWAEVLVPLASSWHPVAVAWGIVGFYCLLAVEITSLLRKKLSKRLWRAVHFLSFPLFASATVHAMTAGTDRSNLVVLTAVLVCTTLVLLLTFVRDNRVPEDKPARIPVRV